MEAPRRGNGADFDQKAAYRMYHGDRIPGFPQHPHRGFETLTATLQGCVDHTDSLGTAGRYGGGDLQWMTAGKGIVHGENFPLVHDDKPNPMELFQIWLNLPAKSKMVDPTFVMHWRETIPKVLLEDGKSEMIVWAGELMGRKGLTPPKDSWASQAGSDVAVWHGTLLAGASVELPPASSASVNRVVYLYEGQGSVSGTSITPNHQVELHSEHSVTLANTGQNVFKFLLLQGKPIGEPVAQHGPFVMNTQQEIRQAFSDYQRTQFGGWPWPEDAVTFPKGKGRFALLGGVEQFPPSSC